MKRRAKKKQISNLVSYCGSRRPHNVPEEQSRKLLQYYVFNFAMVLTTLTHNG